VEMWMGISLDEWQRMRTAEVGYVKNVYTLVDRRLSRAKRRPVSAAKARTILHEGKVHGQKITPRQRRFFGAISSGAPARRKK